MPDTCPEGHSLRNGPRILSTCYICANEARFWEQQLARAELYAAGINPNMHGGPGYAHTVTPMTIREFDRHAEPVTYSDTHIERAGEREARRREGKA